MDGHAGGIPSYFLINAWTKKLILLIDLPRNKAIIGSKLKMMMTTTRVRLFVFFIKPISHSVLLAANLNKEEKLKALENLVTQTEYLSRTGKDSTYLSAQEPVSSEVARTGRLRRSTISRHVVEKATIGGTGGGFAPTLIQNTLRVGGLRF